MAPLTRRQLKAIQAVSRRPMRSLLAAIAALCLVVSGGVWASAALPGGGQDAAPAGAGSFTAGASASGPFSPGSSDAAGSATASGSGQAGPPGGSGSGHASDSAADPGVQGDQPEKGLLWFLHFEQIEKLLDRGSPVEIPTPTLVAGVRGSEQGRRPDPGPPSGASGARQGPADQGGGPATQNRDSSDAGATVPDTTSNLSPRPQPVVAVAPESGPVDGERSDGQPEQRSDGPTDQRPAGEQLLVGQSQDRTDGREDQGRPAEKGASIPEVQAASLHREKAKDGASGEEEGVKGKASPVIVSAETPALAPELVTNVGCETSGRPEKADDPSDDRDQSKHRPH